MMTRFERFWESGWSAVAMLLWLAAGLGVAALLASGCARFERAEWALDRTTGAMVKTGETKVTFLFSKTDLKGLLIRKPDGTHIELKQAGSESQAVELVKAGADIYAKAAAAEEGDGDPDPLPAPNVLTPQIPPLEVREP